MFAIASLHRCIAINKSAVMTELAFKRGRFARRYGKPAAANPYKRSTQRAAWSAGWNSFGPNYRTAGELGAIRQARKARLSRARVAIPF
jgi:ribosome modulation factor